MARLRAALVLTLCAVPCACGDRQGAAGDGGAAALLAARLDAGDGGVSASDAGTAIADEAMPQSNGEELTSRMRHLLEAVAHNNAELASDVMFPRDAYIATKDVPEPHRAWEKRLASPFRRSVERLHKHTKGATNAKFTSFELGHAIVQVSPKRRDLKKPLWRVKNSKLAFSVDGKEHHVVISEMTSFRGSWYVTRLGR